MRTEESRTDKIASFSSRVREGRFGIEYATSPALLEFLATKPINSMLESMNDHPSLESIKLKGDFIAILNDIQRIAPAVVASATGSVSPDLQQFEGAYKIKGRSLQLGQWGGALEAVEEVWKFCTGDEKFISRAAAKSKPPITIPPELLPKFAKDFAEVSIAAITPLTERYREIEEAERRPEVAPSSALAATASDQLTQYAPRVASPYPSAHLSVGGGSGSEAEMVTADTVRRAPFPRDQAEFEREREMAARAIEARDRENAELRRQLAGRGSTTGSPRSATR